MVSDQEDRKPEAMTSLIGRYQEVSMHRICLILFAFCLPQNGFAEPIFSSQNIFPPTNKHAHSSSIVECPDGSFITCWFFGSGERTASDVVVQGARLAKGAKEWSPVFLMADTPKFPDCNPVLFVDNNERLWMFWIAVLAERWENSQLKYRRADQANGEGAPNWTWQETIHFKPGEAFAEVMKERFEQLGVRDGMWAEYAKPYRRLLLEAAQDPSKRQMGWMTRTHPITLPSGRILLPLYSDGYNTSLMGISDDQGKTWRASTPIVGLGPIQPSVVRKQNGELVAYCRDSGHAPPRILVSRSQDDGETWSPATDTKIPNPGSSLEAIVLKNGKWILVCNDINRGRHQLSVLMSTDEGQSWNRKRVIEPHDSEGKTFDYPSVIQSRDGLIHVTYSYTSTEGRCIRHCVMNEEWIEGGR